MTDARLVIRERLRAVEEIYRASLTLQGEAPRDVLLCFGAAEVEGRRLADTRVDNRAAHLSEPCISEPGERGPLTGQVLIARGADAAEGRLPPFVPTLALVAPEEAPRRRRWIAGVALVGVSAVALIIVGSMGRRGAAVDIKPAFAALVVGPNAEHAVDPALAELARWDVVLLRDVLRTLRREARQVARLRRIAATRAEREEVAGRVAERGLPVAIAALPFVLSGLREDYQSAWCRRGPWAFPPEIGAGFPPALRVEDCAFMDAPSSRWTPSEAPPRDLRDAFYIRDERCRIPPRGCRIDERGDLGASTRVALERISRVWSDPRVAASGAAVQIALASHLSDHTADGGADISPSSDIYASSLACADEVGCAPQLRRGALKRVREAVAVTILAACVDAREGGSGYQPGWVAQTCPALSRIMP